MPLCKIEPTGLTIRKGWVQIRFAFYLEPTDARYNEHFVEVPVAPKGGYPGEIDELGLPKDRVAFKAWLAALPKEWVNNPFHNHIEYVDPDISDLALARLMNTRLDEFYDIWSKGQNILEVWKSKGKLKIGNISPANISKCREKITKLETSIFASLGS